MQFKSVIKDAKMTSTGINIHMLGGDDCSTDELRCYFDEPVMVTVEIIHPSSTVEDEYEVGGELVE